MWNEVENVYMQMYLVVVDHTSMLDIVVCMYVHVHTCIKAVIHFSPEDD